MYSLNRHSILNVFLTLSLLLGQPGLRAISKPSVVLASPTACTVSWAVDSDGNWDVDSNWDTNATPIYGDEVCIDRTAGDFTITIRQSAGTVESLQSAESLRLITSGYLRVRNPSTIGGGMQLEGGTLTTQSVGTWTISGNSQWTEGTLSSSGIITNTGTLTLTNPVTRTLSARLDNTGTIIHTGSGNLNFGSSSAKLNNLTGAIYEFQGDADFIGSTGANFNNSGTVRKSGGAGETSINPVKFNNLGGTIEVLTGTLTIGAGGGISTGGTFTISTGAVLDLTGGGFTSYEGTYTGSGEGNVLLASGTLDISGSGAIFNFPEGMFHWTGGAFSGGSTSPLTNTGYIQISGPGDKLLYRYTVINNQGTILQTGINVMDYTSWAGTSYINNQTGGLFEIQGKFNPKRYVEFNNEGIFRKTGSASESAIGGTFNLLGGTVDVQNGTLNLAGGSDDSSGGKFYVSAGAVLKITRDVVTNNQFRVNGTYTGSGAGMLELTGYLTVDTPDVAILDFPDGFFQWTEGVVYGRGELVNEGSITLAGDNDKLLRGNWTNNREFVHTGNGNFHLFSHVNFTNNGLYDIRSDADIEILYNCSGCTRNIKNVGTFRKSAGSGTSEIRDPNDFGTLMFDNTGTVEVQSGTLSFLEPVSQTVGSTLTGGTWKVASFATLNIPSAANITTNQGDVTLIGPTSVFSQVNTLANNEGSFNLLDGRDFTTVGDFTNSGDLTVGDGSTLTVNGAFNETSANSLSVEIGGRPATGLFGQVDVSGQASLTGTLHVVLVDGFGPTEGDTYQVMSFASRNGQFQTVTGLYPFFDASQTGGGVFVNALASAADLALDVASLSIPVIGTLGQNITVSYTVDNLSEVALSGDWTDSVYLSTDQTYSPDDMLIGRVQHSGGVGVLGSYTGSLTAPLPGVAAGDYHVVIIVDSRGLVPDLSRSNNYGASTGLLNVHIPVLPFDVITTGTIVDTQDVYFQLEVPPGGDVVLTINFSTTLEAEVFVRYRELPTRSEFDFTASDLFNLQRQIVLASPGAEPYFVLLHGREGAWKGQAFDITATHIPFALQNVSPNSGSNLGQVTVALHGAGFSESAGASLTDAGSESIVDGVVSPVGSNLLYATFDLSGVTPGLYDVQVVDGEITATAEDAFEVTAGTPGALRVDVSMPGRVRGGRTYNAFIDYTNVGETDLVAPLIFVSSPSNTPFTFDFQAGPGSIRTQFLAVSEDGPAGVLPPGETVRVPLRFRVNVSRNWITTEYAEASNSALMDWDALRDDLREFAMTNPLFDAAFAQVISQTGTTMGDYVTMLAQNATLLPEEWGDNRNPLDLIALELRKTEAALGTSISGRLTVPGLQLNLSGVRIVAANLDTQESFTTISLQDDSFIFEKVTAGSYEFFVEDARVTAPSPGTTTVLENQALGDVVVTIGPGTDVIGQIVALNGDPIPLAALYVYDGDTLIASSSADTNGAYRLNDLPSGTYMFVAAAEGYQRTWVAGVVIQGELATVNVTMGTQATIHGLAMRSGAPAEDLFVFATLQAQLPVEAFGTQGDENGLFTITDLPGGTFTVTLVSSYTVKTLENVTVIPGENLNLGTIVLDANRQPTQRDAAVTASPTSENDFWLEFQLAESEDFLNRTWIPIGRTKWGKVTAGLWALYLDGSSSNPPGRQVFGVNDEVVEGSAVATGFRHSKSLDRQNLSAIHTFALSDIRRMFSHKELKCDDLVQQKAIVLPLESLPNAKPKLELITDYVEIFEIPGNLAGGIGGAWPPDNPQGGADGQEFADRRYLSGSVLITPHGSNSVRVSFLVDMNVEDTIDFLPGNPGSGIERHITLHMIFLEGYDRAYDVPFTINYFDKENFPDEIITFPSEDDCEDPDPPECPECEPGDSGVSSIVVSMDPNEKATIGATDDTETHFIRPGTEIAYTVIFENLEAATAPAQEVFVTDVLGANLDLSTFKLGYFGFGDLVVDVPDGRNYYSTRIDLTEKLGFFVDFEASIDFNIRQVSLAFTSIDTDTGDLVSDPMAGFLPPNDATGRGEGFVTFFITPLDGLSSGTSITNAAEIVFDINDPIVTNLVTNTIDADPPTSSVASLPVTSPLTFTVSWSGDDGAGSGIAFYDVFVSTDGGPFEVWHETITNTQATFTGTVGSVHAFYSVATDNVGHREPTPNAAQATTLTGDSYLIYLPQIQK